MKKMFLSVLISTLIVLFSSIVNAIVKPTIMMVPLNVENKLMGTVTDKREVLDFDGNLVGHLLGDNTIVNEKLEVLGKAIHVVEAILENGKVVGRVKIDLKNKSVHVVDIDDEQKIIGYPQIDGTVVDLKGNSLAFLVPQGSLVIGLKGNVIGSVIYNSQKEIIEVLGVNGKILGYINPKGMVLNKSGKIIGGIVPKGIAIDNSCRFIGNVSDNGKVIDDYEQEIGYVLLDGTVLDADGNKLGFIVLQGIVKNDNGDVVGFVNPEGRVIDSKGAILGCPDFEGNVFIKKKVGSVMGYV